MELRQHFNLANVIYNTIALMGNLQDNDVIDFDPNTPDEEIMYTLSKLAADYYETFRSFNDLDYVPHFTDYVGVQLIQKYPPKIKDAI